MNSDLEKVVFDACEISVSTSPTANLPQIEIVCGPQHFELLKLIGEGAFGRVLLARNRINCVEDIRTERNVLAKLRHPFLCSLQYAFQTRSQLYLIMEFLSGGELFFHLQKRGLLMEVDFRVYAAEMILAVEYLHSKSIIHRDLKPENIMLNSAGHICITDFGLAKEGGHDNVTSLCGTTFYMAPEMLCRVGYNSAVDWWSLGAVFFEMLVGKPPFYAKSDKELYKKIMHEKLVCPAYLTASAHALLKGLLEKDMTKRLGSAKSNMFSIGGVAALKQHSFFQGLDWAAAFRCELVPPIDVSTAGSQVFKDEISEISRNFDQELANRPVSRSLVEDALFALDSSIDDIDLHYADFEFARQPLFCEETEFAAFESNHLAKIQKLEAKKKEKEKREQIQAAKRDAEAETVKLEKLAAEKAAQMLSLEETIAASRRSLEEETVKKVRAGDALLTIQKKIKLQRKKLREVVLLEEKAAEGASLSADQTEKMSRKQSVEDDIRGLLEQELALSLALAAAGEKSLEEIRLQEAVGALKLLSGNVLVVEPSVVRGSDVLEPLAGSELSMAAACSANEEKGGGAVVAAPNTNPKLDVKSLNKPAAAAPVEEEWLEVPASKKRGKK